MSIVVVVVFGTKKDPSNYDGLGFYSGASPFKCDLCSINFFPSKLPPLSPSPSHSLSIFFSPSPSPSHTHIHTLLLPLSFSFLYYLTPTKGDISFFSNLMRKVYSDGEVFFLSKGIGTKMLKSSILGHSWKEKLFQILWNFKISFLMSKNDFFSNLVFWVL